MKNIIHRITLLAAALMILAVPVLAEEGTINPASEPALQSNKDECLLVAMNCTSQVDTIQQKIDRIQGEINKGTAVYSNEELRVLQNKLDNARQDYNSFFVGGGA